MELRQTQERKDIIINCKDNHMKHTVLVIYIAINVISCYSDDLLEIRYLKFSAPRADVVNNKSWNSRNVKPSELIDYLFMLSSENISTVKMDKNLSFKEVGSVCAISDMRDPIYYLNNKKDGYVMEKWETPVGFVFGVKIDYVNNAISIREVNEEYFISERAEVVNYPFLDVGQPVVDKKEHESMVGMLINKNKADYYLGYQGLDDQITVKFLRIISWPESFGSEAVPQ